MYKSAMILAVAVLLVVGIGQSASNKRAYVAGHFALELERDETSFLKSAEGGACAADVFGEPVDGNILVKKHIGNVKYEDISVSCGLSSLSTGKGLYEWVKASFDRKPFRRNGAIIAADFDYTERSRRDFSQALITEIGFPACDGGSKEPAYMTIKFGPETVVYKQGSGKVVGSVDTKQKTWLPSNFRLEIDGLDCKRVNKIEAITVKQSVLSEGTRLSPIGLQIPNLVITVPEAFSQDFVAWHEDFVIKGNNGDDKERSGHLDYLTPDLKTALLTLTFKNLGIFKVSPDKSEAGSDQIRRIKAEMYCEDIQISPPGIAR